MMNFVAGNAISHSSTSQNIDIQSVQRATRWFPTSGLTVQRQLKTDPRRPNI